MSWLHKMSVEITKDWPKWENIQNEKNEHVPFSSTRWIQLFFFIVCVRDLCHQSWWACWGRFSGRGRRVQVEESQTQDGNWIDTPTHLLSEREKREVSRAISTRPADKPAASPPKAGFFMRKDCEIIWSESQYNTFALTLYLVVVRVLEAITHRWWRRMGSSYARSIWRKRRPTPMSAARRIESRSADRGGSCRWPYGVPTHAAPWGRRGRKRSYGGGMKKKKSTIMILHTHT